MKPYENYKETNIPWVKEIPSHWDFSRNKNVLVEQKTVVGENSSDYKLLSLTLNGVIFRDMENAKGKFPKEFDTYKIVKKGNIIFCLFDIDETPRTVGLSKYDGMITGAYDIFDIQNINSEYLYYYYLAMDNVKALKPMYTGLRKVIGVISFKGAKIPVPPRTEQDQIVRFLDWKLSKINKLIKAKKKQIELLKEQKQAIINKAVTKGLDDSVPMKDSGVAWIGEISTEFKIFTLKRLLNKPLMYGANESGIEYSENLSRYIRITDIELSGKLKNYGKLSLSEEKASTFNLLKGDVLLARSGATVGKTFLYKDEEYGKCCFAGYLIKAQLKNKIILPEYFYMYTKSGLYNVWLKQIFIQATIQNISAEKYNYLQVPICKLETQINIVKYLDEQYGKINSIIERILKEIDSITEYRTSLISYVVTGKVDVRDVVIPDFEVEYDIEADETEISDDDIETSEVED